VPPELGAALQRALTVTAALLAVVVLRLPFLGVALRLWLVAVGGIAIWGLSSAALAGWAVSDGAGFRLPWGWWRRARPERVRALEELERAVDFSLGTAFDVHYRLRPHLVRIAAHRLGVHGASLEARPARARAILGPELWELVRPDRPEPEDRNAKGLDPALLGRLVERLHEV
jgi:hypothetical protein